MRDSGKFVKQIFLCLFTATLPALSAPQDTGDAGKVTELAVYTEHPRLFLRPQRLKLLKRETQRQSLRWEQFQALMGAKAALPEPAFAAALYFESGGDKEAGKQAIAWALDPKNSDLRQLALVFDWCQDLLSESENKALAARLQKAIAGAPVPKNLGQARDLLLAAMAIADQSPAESKAAIASVLQKYWPASVVTPLSQGKMPFPRSETLALLEILHATRDNLNVDLRQTFPAWFKPMALEWLLTYYPTPWPAAENEFHIPASTDPVRDGTPDTRHTPITARGMAHGYIMRLRGEGVLDSSFDRYEPMLGAFPVRARSDNNPLDRKEYLLRVQRGVSGLPTATIS